ncbi:MAG: PAS domain S-box protein, partial [Mucilaginibacter sp.]
NADAIVLLDTEGIVLYQTPSAEKILGYNLSEIQEIDGLELIHPDDRAEDNKMFEELMRNPGAVVYSKHRLKHKSGHYIQIEGTYRNLLNDENVKAIVYSYTDVTDKVLSEQNLLESENRFRRAFEDSAIGMGLTSIEESSMGKWLQVNRSLCEMLGYTEDELTSLTFAQITHPEDLARDLAAQGRILQGESDTYRLEKRYIHKDGNIVWINLNVSVVKNKNKQPLYLVAQVENITEKIESQIKFQNLVEHFVVGVYILQNNKLVYVNPSIMEETGYTEAEIIGMQFDKFIYPDDLELVSSIVDTRIMEGLKTVRYEARIKQKNGEPLWYEILGGSTTYQGAPALIGTMVNITERKAVYDELKSSEAKLKSIFDTTDVSYLLLDRNYHIVALNQHMKDSYVEAAGVVLYEGADLMELMPSEKREDAKAAYDKVIKNNEPLDYETTYVRNGASTHFLANVKPIDDGKKIIGICISAIDITERKNALEQLEQLNANLQKKARELAVSNAGLELSEKRYSELF